MVVCGGGAREDAARTQELLIKDPVKLHGQEIKCAEVESYLGFSIHQDSVKASINHSVKTRVNRAWSKVARIKSIMNLLGRELAVCPSIRDQEHQGCVQGDCLLFV